MRAKTYLSALVLLLVTGGTQAEEPEKQRTLSVTGHGEVSASPDLAVVSFAVETTSPEAGSAVDENARKSSALAKAIKSQLDSADKVTTTRYSLDPIYEQRKRGTTTPPKISGYVARNEVRVETHSIDGVGKLIDRATKAGANRINGLNFTLENRQQPLAEALKKAGADAEHQAKAAAASLGVRLGEVVSATTSAAPIPLPRQYRALGVAMAESRPPTPVEPGEVKVSATLHVTYEIE